MPEVTRWLCLFSALFLTGCQSTGNMFSWWPGGQGDSKELSEFAAGEQSVAAVTAAAELTPPPRGGEPVVPVAASGHIDELVNSGIRAISAQQLDQARQSFQEVLRVEPNHATAHQGLAMVADLTKNWTESDYHYKQALKIRPRDPGLLNDVGYSYLLQGRYQEAASYLDQAVELNPKHEKAQENLAMLSLRKGDRADAEARLLRLYPAGEARRHLARLEQDLKNNDQQLSGLLADTRTPAIPAGATLDEVRQLAERERIAAEEQRMRRSMPQSMPREISPRAIQPDLPPAYAQNGVPQNGALDNGSSLPMTANPQGLSAPANQTVAPMQPSAGPVSAVSYSAPPMGSPSIRTNGNPLPHGQQVSQSQQFGANSNIAAAVPAGGLIPVHGGTGFSQAPVHLAGLNAGPGALFPINNSSTLPPQVGQQPAGYQQPPNYPQPAQPMNYPQPGYQAPVVQPPGSQSPNTSAGIGASGVNPYTGQPMSGAGSGMQTVLNGSYLPTPPGVIPGQQWVQQQPPAAQSPPPPTTLSGFNPNLPAESQTPANTSPSQFGTGQVPSGTGAWPAGWQPDPGRQGVNSVGYSGTAQSAAPLTDYERQLQQAQNQSMESLQLMNRQSAPVSVGGPGGAGSASGTNGTGNGGPVQARY